MNNVNNANNPSNVNNVNSNVKKEDILPDNYALTQ